MNLQQLRYLAAIVQSDLNISAAARLLRTSQPGISKQLQMLELETGIPIFVRDGNALKRVTPEGSQLIGRALRILDEVESIQRLSADARNDARGSLSIGTTHTQARYVLPKVFEAFRQRYPDVQLDLHQGTSEQIAAMVKVNQLDFVLVTGARALFKGLIALPVYRWARKVVVPKDHPLAGANPLTLHDLAQHPIVTYVFSVQGSSSLLDTFEAAGLRPRVAMTARDADVIKTYVRLTSAPESSPAWRTSRRPMRTSCASTRAISFRRSPRGSACAAPR